MNMYMNEKLMYAAPQVEAVELTTGGAILTGSETEMSGVGVYVGGGEMVNFDWE